MTKQILREQRAYYEARAEEYDRGLQSLRRAWRAHVFELISDLPGDFRVLELGCGTGVWTDPLAARFHWVTAVDSSARMLAIHRRRVVARNVTRLQRDVFSWQARRSYDLVFFGFLLAHVPPALLSQFWRSVGTALRKGGCAVFVDELDNPAARAYEERLSEADAISVRTLEDGRRFRIIKVLLATQSP
jgi:demethylmenaquinone methyltransferase/2-methoxy-6-polyprenyl-1,4-benzoquinol methylase